MPVIVYSALRLLLIGIAGAGLYLAGMRGVLLVAAAVLLGAALSYVLLDRFRQASALWLQRRAAGKESRFGRGLRADADAEDEDVDRQRGDPASESSDREHHGQADPER
ncbi:DUF4229 domain-containing protein [Ruania suaedae]|uniref:DUF4229 domain-containing protein n=1 Tax=Ruania suaedae TaxID=2897774 RepID=UPI001E2AFF82|nr:DUF4229 domain-containing protein [Ruania suaedae]UFU02497.1 DUF4229 domain-containing protein [Ruania suaedae]